jgi:methyl-accepting chemotaxis protein
MISFPAQPTDKNSGAFPGLRLVPAADGGSSRHVLSGTTDNALLMPWLDALDGLIAGLDRLPPLTEKSFLLVCANLQDLCGRLRGISANAAQAALIMSGRDTLSVIEGLQIVLGSMEEQLAATNRTAGRAVVGLGLIIGELDDIHRLMASFKDRVGTLRMLKIITNIQGAGLTRGAAGFQKVAADIGTLSKNVQTKSSAIIDKRRELHAELEKAVTMASSLKDKQKKLTDRVVADIQHGIASLAGMHEKCAVAADHIAAHSGEMSRELSEVVMALQFHDITRQQMEHARAALAEVRHHLRKAQREATAHDLSSSLGSVCALQTAQIASSTGELGSVVVSISRNLEGVSRDAATASASVHTLFGLAGSVGQASITEIESGLSAVLTSFAENETTTRHLTGIMLSVTAAMGEIISFAEDIDYVGSEIKLIALNAIVKAAHAGKDGAAFGVIAETVKLQSEEICRQASAITAAIGRITVHVDGLRSELQAECIASPDGQPEAVGIGRHMETALSTLKGLSDTVMALLAQTEDTATGLASDIESTIARLDNRELRELIDEEIPCHRDRLMLAVRKCTRGKAAGSGRKSLETLQQRYTMQSERKVHELFAAEAFAGRSLPGFAPAGRGRIEDDFGDNVELF